MQVRVKGRGLQLTERLRDQAITKVNRAVKSFERVENIEVTVTRLNAHEAHHRYRAEISTRAAGHQIRAEGEADLIDQALDLAIRRFRTRLRRLRERFTERRRQSPRVDHRDRGAESMPGGRAGETPAIVRAGRSVGKPMTPEEAAMVMDQGADSVFLFANIETGKLGILHRSADGRLELIEAD